MGHELICTWLGLPSDGWPPDHYRLLGLEPGTADAARVEAEVQRRLEMVRRYQLTHPDQATEVMNRLAQAFVCLTDAESRKAYDAQLTGAAPAEAVNRTEAPADVFGEETADPLAWLLKPRKLEEPAPAAVSRTPPTRVDADTSVNAQQPPVPLDLPAAMLAPLPQASELPAEDGAPILLTPLAPPPRQETGPALQRAEPARAASTRRVLYRRLARTRRLARAWQAAGQFLEHSAWRVSRPAEATDLIEQLGAIRTSVKDFPAILGGSGQPGFLVVALSRQHAIVPTFQTLLPGQREALSRDWRNGHELLAGQLKGLRSELRSRRRRAPVRRLLRAVGAVVVERPGLLLLVLGLLALSLALWREFVLRD